MIQIAATLASISCRSGWCACMGVGVWQATISLSGLQTLGCEVAYMWGMLHWIHGILVGNATVRILALNLKTKDPLRQSMAFSCHPFSAPIVVLRPYCCCH